MDQELPPALELIGVTKQYGPVRALRPVSLRLWPGDTAALLGSNGAGKTTLLSLAATHSIPEAGSVRICGEDSRAAGSAIRSRIGFLSHASCLYHDLTVRENLRFYARLFSVPEPEVLPLVSRFGLSERYNHRVSRLSFGQRKRADIVRASLHRPPLLLLDEPFAGLDAAGCRLLADFLRERQEEGAAILLSSHSPRRARVLCKRVLTVDRGTLAEENNAGAGDGRRA